MKQFLLEEKGVSALYMALALFVLLGMAAIAIDGSNAYLQRRRMQTAADFAALAGARALALGSDTTVIDTEVAELAIANGVGDLPWTLDQDGRTVQVANAGEIAVDWSYTADHTGINVSVANNYDTFFARILGYNTLTSTAAAAAGYLPVVGVDNLLPLTINGCDCLAFDEFPVTLTQDDFGGSVIAVYTVGNASDSAVSYTFYLKNLDPTYPGTTANRPYYMFYDPDNNGLFTVYGDGTARLVEQVVNVNGDGFLVDLRLGGRTTTPPDGQSPTCEGACPNTSDWHYYPTATGTLIGLPGTRYAGAVIQLTRRGAALQVGTNAHLKEPQPNYGAAGWLTLDVVQQPTDVTLNSHTTDAVTNMVFLPLTETTPPDSCALFPIALSTQTLNGATPGVTLGDIWNGVQAGNFGWLTWAGSPNVPSLALSLTPPGNSNTYVNPNNAADTLISVGDWVQGSPGVSNASSVRAALDVLKIIDITVPVWDQATGNGNNSLYRVVNFAIVRITDYQLPSQNRITATFIGYATACGGSAPTATPAPATATSLPTATLPPSTATPTATPTATTVATGACQVTYRVTNDWGSGFTADVIITNQSGAAYNGWSVIWSYAGNQQISNLWNGALTQTGVNVRVNNAAWNGAVNNNGTVSFGFQAAYSGANAAPTNFVVNGVACNGGSSPTLTPTRTPTPTASPTPSPGPEVEYCTYNLRVKVGETFAIRDYVTYKDHDFETYGINWSQVSFTYTGAGANDPPTPADWHLSDFNNGVAVTAVSADRANGTGNQGKGKYRIYLVRAGQTTYDDHMTIEVTTSQSDVSSAKCASTNPPLPTATSVAVPTSTSTTIATAVTTPLPTATPTPLSTATPTLAITPLPATPPPAVGGSCALDIVAGEMNRYSLIVLDDLSTSSDIENRAFVGGSLVSSTSANIGINVQGIAASEPMFVVVGNLAAGNPLNLNAGSLRLGGNRNGRPINFNGGGALVQDPTLFDTEITTLLQAASAQLAEQVVNNGVTLPTGQPGAAKFIVTTTTAEGAAIFQVAAGDLFGNNLVQQIELNPGAASLVVINVTGATVDWSGNGNMVGNFTNSQWRSHVIWNFTQAGSINLRSHNMMGAVLAPYASVTTAANLDGSVAVRALTTSAEVHQPTFGGDLGMLCAETVEPPTEETPCQLAWLDWDGGLASTGELADDLADPGRSGVRRIGEWVAAGPAVADVQSVTHALERWLNQPALIALYGQSDALQGYQICGFAEFTMTAYDFADLPPWLQGEFSPALARGLTDRNAPDYGLRDLRFK